MRNAHPRVLVVDDDPAARDFVRFALTDMGFSVTTAASGQQALEKEGHFDLLLTDLMMPYMTGDELARQMRRRHPDLKVLYVTGYAHRLFAEKHVLREGEAFLEKPVAPQALLEAVNVLLYGTVSGGQYGRRPPSSKN
jgi:two-component system, cell cycle sensor histidine kinase and response regulator CckA